MSDNLRLKRSKIDLYHALLTIGNDKLTPNEIDLMYNLCLDRDIQEVLNISLKNKITMTPSLSKVP